MDDKFTFDMLTSSRSFRFVSVAAVGLLALFLLVKVASGINDLNHSNMYPGKTITVEGTGKATAVPNIAQISFSVTEQGTTVSDAQDKATAKTNAALAAVKAQGIEDKDVKTTGYNVYPRYEYQQPCYSGICPTVVSSPKVIGYEVSQTVEVKVRDTAKAGDVLQGLGNVGAQNISGPNFVVDDADSVQAQARADAIADAKMKAKDLAKNLGVSLGDVVSFSENTGYPMYDSYYGKGGMAMETAQAAPSLPTGENETSISVLVTYEIK